MHTTSPVLELRNITKAFPGIVANDHINLTCVPGKSMCCWARTAAKHPYEHAGPFDLMRPDLIDGVESDSWAQDAIRHGVGMVHQLLLVPVFTVAERGAAWSRRRVFDREAAIERVTLRTSTTLTDACLVQDLPVGIQQRVEIVKALYRDARILILMN